jgi:uncharacterized membrane protein YwaF
LFEGSWEPWNTHPSRWTIQIMVPLDLCNLMMLLACINLILKNYRTYIFVYLLGIGAAWAGKIIWSESGDQ